MDFVRLTDLSSDPATVRSSEVRHVMVVYILLILGGALALIAGLTASRLFLGIGGRIALASLTLFLIWLPAILAQADLNYVFESLAGLVRSLNWGWGLPIIGAGLVLAIGFSRSRKG